jgi:hypothetical protein
MNPICLTGPRPRVVESRIPRSYGEDDCEFYDADFKKLDVCHGDGHYMCKECKSFTPHEVLYYGGFGFVVNTPACSPSNSVMDGSGNRSWVDVYPRNYCLGTYISGFVTYMCGGARLRNRW